MSEEQLQDQSPPKSNPLGWMTAEKHMVFDVRSLGVPGKQGPVDLPNRRGGKVGRDCNCSQEVSMVLPGRSSFKKLRPTDPDFLSVAGRFNTTWGNHKGAFASPPTIKEIWSIFNPTLQTAYDKYCGVSCA